MYFVPVRHRRSALSRAPDNRVGPRVLWLLAVTIAAGGASACDGAGSRSAIEVEDRTGRVVALEAPASRVVSMVPAATEWLVAMGASDRLVARTDFDHDPSLQDLPSVGGGLTPSVEWLIARRPDLVVAWPDGQSRSTVTRLEALGVPVYVAPAETVDEGLAIAADLGRLVDREQEAEALIAAVREGLAHVRDQTMSRPEPTVLFLIGLDPLTAAGPGTFVDELIRAAGGRNALADLRLPWPPVSLEEVVRRDPVVVLTGTVRAPPIESLRVRPGWREIEAVRTGRVHAVDPYMVNRWGPRLHESAALLADLIHGPGR